MLASLPLLHALLQQQCAAYRKTLPRHLAQLDALWPLAARGAPDSVAALHRLAHGMAGAAGTFGLPQLGGAARALELALADLEAKGSHGGSGALGEACADLRQQLLCASQAAGPVERPR